MSLLSRYVFKEYMRVVILTFLCLLSLFIIVSLFDLLTDALEHKASIGSVLEYLFYKIPQALYFTGPVVILVSTILSIGAFSKSNEIIAMKACGIGILQIAAPIFMVSLVMCGVTFLNGEYMLPFANEKMDRIRREDIKNEPRKVAHQKDKLWFRSDDGSLWDIGLLGKDGTSLRKFTIFQRDNRKTISRRISCMKAEWDGTGWQFLDCWIRTFDRDGTFKAVHVDQKSFEVGEKPSDFVTIKKDPDKMSYTEMREYIQRIKKEGLDPTRYLVDMQSKLSFPFMCVTMALMGLPFALRTGREGGVTLGIGVGVSIGFSLWFIYSMALSLGRAGKIPVLPAAWGSGIAFALIGLYLLKTSE